MTSVSDPTQALRDALVADLVKRGDLRSPSWIAAFKRVPRHVFVPQWYRNRIVDGEARNELIDSKNPNQHTEWLTGVYSDRLLLISTSGSEPSSSTQPALMANMLEALQIDDGMSVLEIGTGSGYNAALLCERLGSEQVTTIDINSGLVETARLRLAAAGYSPTVETAHGSQGHSKTAPYDRLIATCGVTATPQPWIEQTRTGGKILAPIANGLALLNVDSRGHGHGRFLGPAYFMPLRSETPNAPMKQVAQWWEAKNNTRPTHVDGKTVWTTGLRFMLSLALPEANYAFNQTPEDTLIYQTDGSWAHIWPDSVITSGGPRNLADSIERTHRLWSDHGEPTHDRYRITVTPQNQTVWLDHSNTHLSWPLSQTQ